MHLSLSSVDKSPRTLQPFYQSWGEAHRPWHEAGWLGYMFSGFDEWQSSWTWRFPSRQGHEHSQLAIAEWHQGWSSRCWAPTAKPEGWYWHGRWHDWWGSSLYPKCQWGLYGESRTMCTTTSWYINIYLFWCWRQKIQVLGVDTMPADALAPKIASAPAGMVLSV